MKSFEAWTSDLAQGQNTECVPDLDELPDGLYRTGRGQYMASCVNYGELTWVDYWSPGEDFDPEAHYCNSGPPNNCQP